MRRLIAVDYIIISIIFTVFFLASSAHASPIPTSWENFVEIGDDGSTTWNILLNYSEPVDKSDYFIFARIYDVSVYSENNKKLNCELVPKDVGSLIICNGISSQDNTSLIKYKFRSNNQVSSFDDFRTFRNGMSITSNLEYFLIEVKLPLGSTIVDKEKLKGAPIAPFEPAYGQEGSDGRRITITWQLNKPRLGEAINISIIYESLPFGLGLILVVFLIIIVVIASILATYYLKKVRIDAKGVLDILSEGERKVMEIVFREKKVDQRIIVRETDYSKAKVSRIIHSLASRGLVDAAPKGRTKLITLRSIKKNIFESFKGMKIKYKISSLKLSREQALELTKFLTGIMDTLGERSKELESKEITNIKQIKIPQKLHVLYEDLKKMYPNIDERLDEYNSAAEKIEKDVLKAKQIINKKFGKKFELMLRENSLDEHLSKDFPELIINNKIRIHTEYKEFWDVNGKKILKIRESKSVKTIIEELGKNSENIERILWDLREDLENLREEVRKSYNILVKEFY